MGISAAIVYSAIYYAWLAARVKFATVRNPVSPPLSRNSISRRLLSNKAVSENGGCYEHTSDIATERGSRFRPSITRSESSACV